MNPPNTLLNLDTPATLTALECVPKNVLFVDTYQQNTWNQIVWDDNKRTIRGKEPRQYLYDGLIEESIETYGEDRVNQDYNRLGALTLLPNIFIPDSVTDVAVTRHTKEFGDVSWYLSNFLAYHSLEFSHAVAVGKTAWQLDILASPRGDSDLHRLIETEFPWVKYVGYLQETNQAAKDLLALRRDERIQQEKALLIAAGKLVVSMMHLAVVRFNTTYADILDQNKTKLQKRIAEGTVFDKSGGDDR